MIRDMREKVGDDFWLMLDCWMSLDLDYATRLAHRAAEYGLKWIEEALLPDDYWGYAELRRQAPAQMLVTTGEHEATRWGFRLLLEMDCCDIIQPDVGWCGGITELRRISALADAHGKLVVPHGSSVYSYHFVVTRHNSPFAEFLMMHPDAEEVVPMFSPMLLGEPVPERGRLKVPDTPGFGVELDPASTLDTRRFTPLTIRRQTDAIPARGRTGRRASRRRGRRRRPRPRRADHRGHRRRRSSRATASQRAGTRCRRAGCPASTSPGSGSGAPIARPGAVLCIGQNYAAHAAESGAAPPEDPIMFFKHPNTVVGPFDDVRMPPRRARRSTGRSSWPS